ncbi:isocyanide synthase family protein [Legionella spiritensis]|uniref:isocyanide synthase family protein n=1 Tax=Legionella spiritensis TaxID=452 RepID=UPI000F709853|nr:isocyanide synthase family protein [Legionella spiritensis]VEG92038.1 pyoverdine biosynthesis protein PvcA [Legionella spiritensis]
MINLKYQQNTTEQLLAILIQHRRVSEQVKSQCQGTQCQGCTQSPRQHIEYAVTRQLPLTMILPAFPAKSANRDKTLSEKPDLGEIMGLQNLNVLCETLQDIHQPGVCLIICSDGRVFNDLVSVSDQDVDIYQQGIKDIIKEHRLRHLSTFSLDDIYPYRDYNSMRDLLMRQFGESLQELTDRIQTDDQARHQFNGIHRFIMEDQLALYPALSRNQVRKQAKPVAYEVIRRSNAWSRLLADYFPHGLRLSIHPQLCGSEKLGINFLPATNHWATPWHNVLLKNEQGWQLIKRRDAEQLGAILRDNHYVLETR